MSLRKLVNGCRVMTHLEQPLNKIQALPVHPSKQLLHWTPFNLHNIYFLCSGFLRHLNHKKNISIDNIASVLTKFIGDEKIVTFQCQPSGKYDNHPQCCIIFESSNINYVSKLGGNQFANKSESSHMTSSMMTVKQLEHDCKHSCYNTLPPRKRP